MESQAANIILGQTGPADRFKLKYGWFTFNLRIKPITARQIIEISGEVAKIRDIDAEKELFPALVEGAFDIRYIAKVITIATGTRFRKIVTRAILKLPLKDIQTLFGIVRKQSDAEVFFYIIISAKGRMNLMKKKQE
jgi:hypothetical protein